MIPGYRQVENIIKYRMWKRSFIIFKDTLVDHSSLKRIQRNVNWKSDVCNYWSIWQQSHALKMSPLRCPPRLKHWWTFLITLSFTQTWQVIRNLFLQKSFVWDCLSLPNMSQILYFSNSPTNINHYLPMKFRHKCHFKKMSLRQTYKGHPTTDPRFW
jgi:hypothetical protein